MGLSQQQERLERLRRERAAKRPPDMKPLGSVQPDAPGVQLASRRGIAYDQGPPTCKRCGDPLAVVIDGYECAHTCRVVDDRALRDRLLQQIPAQVRRQVASPVQLSSSHLGAVLGWKSGGATGGVAFIGTAATTRLALARAAYLAIEGGLVRSFVWTDEIALRKEAEQGLVPDPEDRWRRTANPIWEHMAEVDLLVVEGWLETKRPRHIGRGREGALSALGDRCGDLLLERYRRRQGSLFGTPEPHHTHRLREIWGGAVADAWAAAAAGDQPWGLDAL